ncbi:hypothetical protein [Roseibium algae]|uniref:MORN repeat protein n=1 Tax=Roseibium algae TaxID=3123038 RepID=A0ABU8TG71_9HYPH
MNSSNFIEYRVEEKLDDQGRLLERKWCPRNSNDIYRQGGPALETFSPESGKLLYSVWCEEIGYGVHRNEDFPARISIDEDSGITYDEEYCRNGMTWRDGDKPATIARDRKNGAVICLEYFIGGNLHRDYDLPAIMAFDRNTGDLTIAKYYQYGKLHRENGPAVIEYNDNAEVISSQYYINGQKVSEPTAALDLTP